jgi:predicted Zn-dependent peptidase
MENTEAVTVLFLARVGSKFEEKGVNGISHLLEHLLFRGTKSWPQPTAISQELDQVGGFYNAFTDKEMLGIIVKVSPENLALAVEIIAEMVEFPLLKDSAIVKEKNIVIEEINMREDNPQGLILDLWEELLYGEQPAGWPVSGEKQTMAGISRAELFGHLKTFFTGKNCLVSVAGNFKEASFLSQVRKRFAGLPKKEGRGKLAVRDNQLKPSLFFRHKKTDQTHLCLGVRGFNTFSPKRHVMEVIATILGGMMSSRLFIEVREKRGLAYYIRTSNQEYTDSGYLVTHAGINSSKVPEAIEVICREYQRIKTKKLASKELAKAKENIRGHFKLGLETSDQFASFFGLQGILEKKILTPEEEWREIAKITSDDILKVAKEVFRSDKLNLALTGPQKDGRQFSRILRV